MTTAPALAGADKAALLLLALDEDVAAALLKHLDEGQLKKLAARADRLDASMADHLDATFIEFERMIRAHGPVGPAAAGSYFRGLAARAIGAEKAHKLLAPPAPPPGPLDALKSAPVATLVELLLEEHPQIAAVILAQLPHTRGAEVLRAMPEKNQGEIFSRLAKLKEIPAQTLHLASEVLARSLASDGVLGEEQRTFDGVAFAAGMLNAMPAETTTRLLDDVSQRSEPAAKKIREAMFTFEDLGRLTSRAIAPLMREVQPDQLVIALKTASEDLRLVFFGAISSRAAASMMDDLSMMPPMRLSDVEIAQRAVVAVAMRLAAEGKLVLPTNGKEELV